MESLIFALNAVAPLIALAAIGYFLKCVGLMDGELVKKINRLVFRVFLPVSLFLNVYKISDPQAIEVGYLVYAVVATLCVFFLSLFGIGLIVPQKARRGALVQAAFRSNYALVGIPLASALYGEEGVIAASLLSAFILPVFNTLAVITLSVFRDGEEKVSVKKVLLGIAQNPLIQSIALGLVVLLIRSVFVRFDIGFRLSDVKPLYTTLDDLSRLSTPLALLVLGAQVEFSTVSALKKELAVGVLLRALIVPSLGLGVAYFFFREQFSGEHFASFVAVFATPVAVSSVPMTQEMKGDATLMGQLVVWTTLISVLSIFLASFLLRLGGAL